MQRKDRPIYISGMELCIKNISGIPRYVYETIKALDKMLEDNKQHLLIYVCYPSNEEIMLPELNIIKLKPLKIDNRHSWTYHFSKEVKKNKGIYCGFANNKTLVFNSLITLHDIRPLAEPNFDSFKKRLLFLVQMLSIRAFAKRIVTVSEYQRLAISKKLLINKNRVFVSYSGHEHIYSTPTDETIFERYPQIEKEKYYYTIGSVAKHKNYKWIIEMALRNQDKMFVVAGKEMNEKWKSITPNHVDIPNILYVGYVSDEENKSLIQHCKALLHPAYYEGFGLPPLEALALGRPAFVSNASCLKEIYKDLVSFFDPDDYNVNLDLMYFPTEGLRDAALKKYSWSNVAGLWLNLFKESQ